VGDFNSDGNPDLAVTNSVSNTISVLLGNGAGTFQSPLGYSTGIGPVSVVAGDFNRDGHPDLAVANAGSESVSILLGTGDGTFRSHVDYATGFRPQSVVAADFNGDSNLELEIPLLSGTVLAVLLACVGMAGGQMKRLPASILAFLLLSLSCINRLRRRRHNRNASQEGYDHSNRQLRRIDPHSGIISHSQLLTRTEYTANRRTLVEFANWIAKGTAGYQKDLIAEVAKSSLRTAGSNTELVTLRALCGRFSANSAIGSSRSVGYSW
jgi:hypothetical protein